MPERARLAALACFLLCLGMGPASAQEAKPQLPNGEKATVRIGTNLVAGLYYPAGGALCRVLAKSGLLRCLIESTNGSTANIRGLLAGDLEFRIVCYGNPQSAQGNISDKTRFLLSNRL